MTPIAFVIAGQGRTELANICLWFVILIAALLIFVAAIYFLRWMALNESAKRDTGFTIEQIDRLHDRGVLTEEEYRHTRRAALGLTDLDMPEK